MVQEILNELKSGVSETYQRQRENWETLGQQQQDYRSFASAVYVCYRE